MAKKRRIFRWRRLILIAVCAIAGAVLIWAIGRQLGVNQAVADWEAEQDAIRKGNANAAAIERDDAAATARRAAPEARPRRVTVAALFAAYRADPQAAQRTYGEGKLEVAGEVARAVGSSGEGTIEFVSPVANKTVSAFVAPEDADLISVVQPGARISLLCDSVTAVRAMPELSDCHF